MRARVIGAQGHAHRMSVNPDYDRATYSSFSSAFASIRSRVSNPSQRPRVTQLALRTQQPRQTGRRAQLGGLRRLAARDLQRTAKALLRNPLALNSRVLRRPDRALQHAKEAVAMARSLAHPEHG